jgi:hypothetical protein
MLDMLGCIHASDAMIVSIAPSPRKGDRSNRAETRPRAKPFKRGCSPNLLTLKGTPALKGGEEDR